MNTKQTHVPTWVVLVIGAFGFAVVIYCLTLAIGTMGCIEIAGSLLLVSVAIIVWRRIVDKRQRHENPKDYALYLYARWGPSLRLKPMERLRRGFPERSTTDLEAWLNDFRVIDAFLASLIERACSEVLTREGDQSEVQKAFPFLQKKGLQQATFRVSYEAWHEGHPLKKP